MGKFIEQNPPGSGKWNARIGGKPDKDWTGLDLDQTYKSTPFHYRKAEMTSDIKGYCVRSTGLLDQFKSSSDVLRFQGRVWKHLTAHGLETISYLRDPTNEDAVLDVVNSYPLYMGNMKKSQELIKLFRNKFDSFDMSNDSAAKTFLLDSLDDKLATSLERRVRADDGFVVAWLKLIQLVLPPSLDRFDVLKDKIKSGTLTKYAGQDVRALTDDYVDWATNLQAAGQYDHTLTRTMVRNVMRSNDLPAQYSLKLSQIMLDLEESLKLTSHMSLKDKLTHMEDKALTFEEVCEIMATDYDVLVSNDEWAAAKLPSDSTSVPASFANLSHHLKTLIQNASTSSDKKGKKKRDPKDVTCYKCGKKGHYANRCPENSKAGRNTATTSWKSTPPGDGEDHTKKVKENVFHWCAKCHRWTTTHTTATNTSKRKDGKDNGPSETSASLLELDPSVWCCSHHVPNEVFTRNLHQRLQCVANVIPVQLNPEGDVLDHLSQLEFKVWECVQKGTVDFRLAQLEDELGVLDDLAYWELLNDDSGQPFDPFPVPFNENDSTDDDITWHDTAAPQPKRPKTATTYLAPCLVLSR